MKKINNYIKYLLILILLQGTNIYAQASETPSQVTSQSQQGISNIIPSLNLSFLHTITSKSWYYLFNYVLPFLFAFGVLLYLAWELLKKHEGEINRPLFLVLAIIAFFIAYYLHAALIVLAIFIGIILLFIWLYKLSHSVTGNILGTIIIILLAYLVLTSSSGIMGFLSTLAFYIGLFILFIFIFIYGYKLSQSNDIKKLERVIYHIRTPQDVRNLQNDLRNTVTNFNQFIIQIKGDFTNLVNTLRNNYLGQHPNRDINKLINLLRNIRNNINNFINTYEKYKMDLDRLEALINGRYTEPLRSHLLKILEEEGKKRIKNIAETTYREYLQEYQTLRNNRPRIRNLALNRKYKIKIDKIFNDMERLLHSFQI